MLFRSTEGIHSESFFKQYKSNCHYIIFSNGWWDSDHYPLPINYTLVWHLFFLIEMCDTYNSPNRFCYYLDQHYKFDYPKSCVFVSTIGNVRPERDYIVEQLTTNLDHQNVILRYSGQDLYMPADKFDVISFEPGKFDPYISILEKYYHNVSQSLPIDLYNQSYFNLVVETDIDVENSFLPSEKIIKTLVTGMPFVAVATQNFLKNLKQLGFKTYSTFWNEDYDLEPNHQKRIDKVVELCNNLKNFDWQSNKDQLEAIANYNAKNFLNLNLFEN